MNQKLIMAKVHKCIYILLPPINDRKAFMQELWTEIALPVLSVSFAHFYHCMRLIFLIILLCITPYSKNCRLCTFATEPTIFKSFWWPLLWPNYLFLEHIRDLGNLDEFDPALVVARLQNSLVQRARCAVEHGLRTRHQQDWTSAGQFKYANLCSLLVKSSA